MKLNKIKVAIMSLLLIATFTTSVKASTNHLFNVTVEPEVVTLKPGEEVTISINLSDINMGKDGINTLEGMIKYDKNVLEEITSSSIQSFNNWSTTYNDGDNSLNGKFLAVKIGSGEKQNTKILSVTFKAKQSIEKETTTQIEFTELTSNDGTDLIKTENKKVSLNLEKGGEKLVVNNTLTQESGNTQKTGTIKILVCGIIALVVIVILGIKLKKRKM